MAAEDVYDAQIAPLLLAAAKIAQAEGIALVCFAQWGPRSDEAYSGSTYYLPHDEWPEARVAYLGARALGNVDRLIWALQKDGKKHGHNSVSLRLLECSPSSCRTD